MAVTPPIMVTIIIVSAECSKIGKNLATKKTPAVTIVAACIRALTGVGPSIASGSQVWRGNCPDLPIAPMNIPKAIKVKAPPVITPASTSPGKFALITWISR